MSYPSLMIIRRGNATQPARLPNGDIYDSTIDLYDRAGTHIYHCPLVNTDHTRSYRGGILAPGNYSGITGPHRGKFALWIFIGRARRWQDVTEKQRTLPSMVANPNQQGRHEMKYINIHPGGRSWDWSHGCITIHPDHWPALIANWPEHGPMFKIELK